jgi:O-antigen/teichoic acid export membrane protein
MRFVFAHQFQTVVVLLVGFIATPFLLKWLGQDRYGLVRVLEAWAAILGMGLWCLGIALGAGLVPRFVNHDWPGISRAVSAAAVVAGSIGVVVFVLGVFVVWEFPHLNPASSGLADEWSIGLLITLGGVLLGPLAVARTLFEADQRGYRVSLVLTATSLLTTALALMAAWRGWGVPGQAGATVVGGAATGLALAGWARRTYPELRIVRPRRADLAEMVWQTSRLLIAGLCGALAARSEVLAANRESGPDGVTRYVLTQRLFAMWQGQLLALGTALWAPLVDLYARGERAAFQERIRIAYSGIIGLGFAGSVAFVGYTQHFLRLWRVGEAQFIGPVAAGVFALIVPLAAIHSLQGWIITTTGHFRQNIVVGLVFAVTAVAGTFGLGAVWGLAGVACGMLAGFCLAIGACTWVLAHHLAVPSMGLVTPLARGLLLAVPIGGLSWWAGDSHQPNGWAGLLAEMGAWFVLYLVAWYATAGHEDRSILKDLVRRALGR